MTDTDTVERVASAMWESRGNASTWDDAENTALVSIYRNLARAAIAALPPAVPDRLAEAIARDESSLRGFLDWDRKTDLSGTQYENLKAAFKAGARHAFNTTLDPVAEAAKVILQAGCSGVPTLTWEIDKAMNGEPDYPQGDAWYDNKPLYLGVEAGLRALTKDGEAG